MKPELTENNTTNEKHKSSVFSLLFSKPEILRELYSAIEGVSLPPDIPIDINTLSNVLYMGRLNDVSFTIDNRLVVLIEHQSTINENMPIRLLIYLARLYEKIINPLKFYQTKLEKIQKPEFIVLYNGNEPFPDQKELKLSNAFKEAGDLMELKPGYISLELTVQVYNINYGHNPQMLERCEALGGYSLFIDKIREFRKNHTLDDSMEAAIKYCIHNNILRNFLEIHGSEVTNMLITDWNWDDAKEVWQEEAHEKGMNTGIQKGHAQGLAQGLADAKLEIARKMKNAGRSFDEIIEFTGLNIQTMEKL